MGVDMDMDMDVDIFLLFRFFRIVFGYFGKIETLKQAVSILKRTNRNKRLDPECAETSFGYLETKPVS